MKNNKKKERMRIYLKKDEGFELDIPCFSWLVFCVGAGILMFSAPSFIAAIRWW